MPAILAEENEEISGEVHDLLIEMSDWLRTLEVRTASCDEKLARKFKGGAVRGPIFLEDARRTLRWT
jgi:hypothetical protein